MPPSKFLKHALKIIDEHPQVFEALAEYDRTHKLQKTIYRERINLTIDGSLLKKFKHYAQENGFNMSRIIEKHIKEELKLG
ncbi:TPA: type II toxin-antitoxin system CcdA family antitoxin [Candidatus Woesearchaeota archaeon]|nr:type II toxin-antitoxin system CcdA family antitoxin [Candidatus Woesearchaeota archaeon]